MTTQPVLSSSVVMMKMMNNNLHHNDYIILYQLTLTLEMNTAQVIETSVTVNNNSPIQDYVHPDDQTQPTFEMTPGFKPFTLHVYHTMKYTFM